MSNPGTVCDLEEAGKFLPAPEDGHQGYGPAHGVGGTGLVAVNFEGQSGPGIGWTL